MKRLVALMVGIMGLGVVAVLPACVSTPDAAPVAAVNDLKQSEVAPVYGLDLENKQHARSFSTQPPMVPHKFGYEINLQKNACLKCHDKANAKAEDAPAAGASHYKTPDGKVQDKLVMSRYFCNQCHAPLTKAAPLVENTFQGDLPAKK